MRKKDRVVIGFYKDRSGETRPITSSEAKLTQKKIIQQPKTFLGIRPKNSSYHRALKLLISPRVATIQAGRGDRLLVDKPATVIIRNHVQGFLAEGKIDRLTLKDAKGNLLFDSEVLNPRASRHWFITINGNIAGDFRSKSPIMADEALIVARDLYARQADRNSISVLA